MARERTTETLIEPSLPDAAQAQEGIIFYTIGLGILVGLILGWVALQGKQWWLLTWCVGLVGAGIVAMVLF